MKMASIWKHEKPDAPSTSTTWLGSLVTTVEVDFPISAVFLTNGAPPEKILDWAAVNTTGRIAIRHLDDGRGVIAVSSKHDASKFKSDFADHLDFGVVSTTSSPEKVLGFIKNMGRKVA